MSDFLRQFTEDVRHGRESWRVLTIASAVSFAVAVAVRLNF